MDDKFTHVVDPMDKFLVKDCRHAWKCRLLEFLVPIIYPEKPTKVTIMLGNTIFGVLEDCPVD